MAIISPTNIAPDLDLAAVIGTHRDARKAPPRTLGCERRMDGILTCVGSGAKIQTRGSAAEVYGDRRGKKARKSFAASVRADFPRNAFADVTILGENEFIVNIVTVHLCCD